jgi:hypothetical protein
MARDIVVQIERTQTCEICVRVDDNVSDLSVYRMDAAQMLKGLIGVDWESNDYRVDDVIAVVDDPDLYPRLNLSAEE